MTSGWTWESISGWTRMERARTGRIVPAMVGRSRIATLVTVLAVVVLVSGCALGDAPPPAGVRPDGFPTGVFAKSIVDPEVGPVRLSWVFEADGDWAEVPESTAGRTLTWPVLRGRYTVDGDLLSINVDAPAATVASHRHHWELEGDRLITSLVDSDNPDDIDWFHMLDQQPWVRVS